MIKSFSRVDLEASFTRVHQHTRNRNVGMILASRDNLTSEENRKRHAALKSDVRKAGYGFVEGRYVDETSLLVVEKKGDDGGALLGHLKHLGESMVEIRFPISLTTQKRLCFMESTRRDILEGTNTSKLAFGMPIELRNSIR
jgi:hypothetical protein